MGKHGPNWYDNFVEKHKIDPLNIPMQEDEKIVPIGDMHEQTECFYSLMADLAAEPKLKTSFVSQNEECSWQLWHGSRNGSTGS